MLPDSGRGEAGVFNLYLGNSNHEYKKGVPCNVTEARAQTLSIEKGASLLYFPLFPFKTLPAQLSCNIRSAAFSATA